VTVLDKVKSGEIDGTVAQGMYNMGYWSLMMLYTEANVFRPKLFRAILTQVL